VSRSPSLVLGIDVGNSKIKFCSFDSSTGEVRQSRRHLPYTDRQRYRRHADFEAGLPGELAAFLSPSDAPPAVAVAVISSGYAYPRYTEGVVHTMGVLAGALPATRVFALSGTGEAIPADVIRCGDPAVVGPIVFSNGMGAVHRARRLPALGNPATGLVLDTGGSTTAITPIVNGMVDPAACARPAQHLDHRLQHGKLTWIGAQTTPLEALCHEIQIGARHYPVIPRGVTSDNLSVLFNLLPEGRGEKLGLFSLVPNRALALRAVADAINLDFEMATEDEILQVGKTFLDRAIDVLAAGIERALATAPSEVRLRAVSFGLGARGYAVPALLRAGVPAHGIVLGEEVLTPEISDMASCFGAALLAAELHLRRRLTADIFGVHPGPPHADS
jgi:hypothetical protein